MEPKRFDRLSCALAAHGPRRGVLGLLAAVTVVGGLLGILSPEETEAAGRRKRRKKAHKHGKGRRRKHRNHKKKTPTCTSDTVTTDCPAHACQTVTCTSNQCAYDNVVDGTPCGSNATCCAGVCSDLHTDSQNCGACGAICASGTTCVSSLCKLSCPGPTDCFQDPSGCICMGSESGALVCVANENQVGCTTDLECEQAFGPGRLCSVDPGSSPYCQANYRNLCVW